ncbi:hypothetical protein BKA65DRAFT_414014 [Rhexocercosporidium sp. MPI-PUGE-AT-0058]|nr:hypothetical protein BKA65DRAFT_414014 [Rhexocercosporidium sp. MPI-PUGE-AT-0058]
MLSSTTLAVFGLATLGSSHMIMNSPTPFGKSSLNNSPLDASGSDFPCKQRPGVYNAEGASNTWPLGSTQSLSFTGSATHGGGSCQVSISYDKAPTASSTWKVIHSIEGGCPIKGVAGNNGNNANAVNPDTYPFKVPEDLPTGTAVMAWTWFNKIGNREMYMNCAPITLTSGSSKRNDESEIEARNATQLVERDTAAFDALPNMFIANIPSESCLSVDSNDLAFPDPGDSVVRLGLATATPSPPTGPSCGVTGSPPKATGASSAAASPPKATQKPTSAAGIPGGVFATVPTSAASEATKAPVSSANPIVSAAPVASPPSVAPVAPVASPVASAVSPAPSSGTSNGTTGSGTAQVAGSACATEGMWNCIGGTAFQQCGSGTWSVVQQLAAGTSCSAGESAAINITASGSKAKRAIRFSSAHVRRHLHKS